MKGGLKKIYLVSLGEYSQYERIGCFSTRKKAEEYMKHFNTNWLGFPREYNEIEEITLDKLSPMVQRKQFMYRVGVKKNGEVVRINREHEPESEFTYDYIIDDDIISFCIWATTKTKAIRMAHERTVNSRK